MKIIILITVVESFALMLWMIYSYHKRRPMKLPSAAGEPSVSSPKHYQRVPLLDPYASDHWSFMNAWQVPPQHDDRPPMNGFVPPQKGTVPSVRRAFARQCHQLMYKKWSKERHD